MWWFLKLKKKVMFLQQQNFEGLGISMKLSGVNRASGCNESITQLEPT